MGAYRGRGGDVILIRNHENRSRAGEVSVAVPAGRRYDPDPNVRGGNTKLVVGRDRRVREQYAVLGGTHTNCARRRHVLPQPPGGTARHGPDAADAAGGRPRPHVRDLGLVRRLTARRRASALQDGGAPAVTRNGLRATSASSTSSRHS
jgi:hypothetical protein